MNIVYLQLMSAKQLFKIPMTLSSEENVGCTLFEASGWLNLISAILLYLCVDYVQQIMGDKLIPVLRKLKIKRDPSDNEVSVIYQEAKEMLWLPATRNELDEIYMYISDAKGNIPSLKSCKLYCLLLFLSTRRINSTW